MTRHPLLAHLSFLALETRGVLGRYFHEPLPGLTAPPGQNRSNRCDIHLLSKNSTFLRQLLFHAIRLVAGLSDG
ncbi:hypothetical protein C8R45DRAFT_961877 [Mycena sanguinolenta]|nr:hypothetical protein C8R45DRAFT_961877 [Mycena sanguinolenta]